MTHEHHTFLLDFQFRGCPLFVLSARAASYSGSVEVKKRWTSITACCKAYHPHCAHRWKKLDIHYAPYVQEIRLRLGQPVLFTMQGRLCPAAKFLPGARLPTVLDAEALRDCFCSSAAARSTPMRTS